MTVRPLEQRDVGAATAIIDAREPWGSAGFAGLLDDAMSGHEHRAIVSDDEGAVTGVAIYRMVAGAVGTGEIECVVGTEHGRMLVDQAVNDLRNAGARLIVAEYPTTYTDFAQLLSECGFTVAAIAHDVIADGVGIEIAIHEFT